MSTDPMTRETDIEFEDEIVSKVEAATDDNGPYFCVTVESGGTLYVSNPESKPLPPVGETIRFYGRGFGYPVRGVTWGDVVYRYQSEAGHKAAMIAEQAARASEQVAKWEAAKEANEARIEAMPAPFRDRVRMFMGRHEWGPKFGPYELFVCEEAIKIAAVCSSPDDIAAFHGDPERQKGVISDEHSGNTFGAACSLAACFLATPTRIVQMHGALCPLVGCVEYGCYSTLMPIQ